MLLLLLAPHLHLHRLLQRLKVQRPDESVWRTAGRFVAVPEPSLERDTVIAPSLARPTCTCCLSSITASLSWAALPPPRDEAGGVDMERSGNLAK